LSDWRTRQRIRLQWIVVRAQRYWLPGVVLRWICRAGTWNVCRRLVKIPGVEAVYARHTHPQSASFVPGYSDLDLSVVLSDRAGDIPEITETVAELLERRRLYYYYLNPQDARIISAGELARLTGKYSAVEILVSPADWKLLAGREMRREAPPRRPARKLPWHPEFNNWWGHILQDYLLIPMPGLENQYHRVFYRAAIKQSAYFMLARGLDPPRPGSPGGQGLAEWVFRNDPTMRELLSGLGQRDFWEAGQRGIRELIFHDVLSKAADFFVEFSSSAGIAGRKKSVPAKDGPHDEAYSSLASKLEGISGLKSSLTDVLAYPTPYFYPYFYQADLLLPENISAEGLSKLADLLRKEFGGREFGVKGRYFSITLVPEKVYRTPLALRGKPFPFLVEHVERHGRMLFSSEQWTAGASAGRDELIDWCRMFFPFFAFNLGRRVEHSSRTLNFCHIAAVRLYLQTGEIVTDPTVLRGRHRAVFGDESPPAAVWEYLQRDKPGRRERTLYRSAASHLAQELGKVEIMLDGAEDQRLSGVVMASLR